MTYTRDKASYKRAVPALPGGRTDSVKVLLPRRALQLQSGSVRYDYQHGIRAEDFCGERRVSLTFRQNKYGKFGV